MSSPEALPPPWQGILTPPPLPESFALPELGVRRNSKDDLPPVPEDLERAAYQRGFDDGYSEGATRAAEQLRPVQERFAVMIEAIAGDRVTALRSAEQNVYAVAIAVAHQLFLEEVRQTPEVVARLVRKAVALLPAGDAIEIRAHPDDLATLGTHSALTEPDGRPLTVHWVADPALERGSFTLEGPERLVDGRTDVALRNLYDRLAND